MITWPNIHVKERGPRTHENKNFYFYPDISYLMKGNTKYQYKIEQNDNYMLEQ